MGIWNRLLKTEQNIRKRVENAFGHGSAQTPLEVRREILEQVESGIVVDSGGANFPFARIVIGLKPPNEVLHDVFEAAFLQDSSLKEDILEKLKGAQAQFPSDLDVVVEFRPADTTPDAGPWYTLDLVRPDPALQREIPEVRLTVVKGTAERPAYRMKQERILVGRLPEVLDREGRLVRRNDVVFLDNGEEINGTVGRAHARIWFDSEKREYYIMDEVSRYGTQIFRQGRSIEAPGGNPRGIRLRSGDDIYFGQACLQFELPDEPVE